MAKPVKTQILDLLNERRSFLLVLPETPSIDAITAALVLKHWAAEKNKSAEIVSQDFKPAEKLSFLLKNERIEKELSLKRQCYLSLDTEKYPISDLSYKKENGQLSIILTPKRGQIKKEHVEITSGEFQYDLVIALNTVELPALGNVYLRNRVFFEEIPVINIDHRPENEQYGDVNWIDIPASSTSEMIYRLLFDHSAPDKKLSTLLLAGIMDATHAFRSQNLKSETLALVGKLLQAGAEHEQLVNNLYRTKTVNLLRLWGHALDHLQADREHYLVWSSIPQSIFETTGTTRQDVNDLMDEILSHTPEAKVTLLFLEHPKTNQIEVLAQSTPPIHTKDLLKNWQPVGSERRAHAFIDSSLPNAEKEVIRLVKERLNTTLKK